MFIVIAVSGKNIYTSYIRISVKMTEYFFNRGWY